MKNTFAKKVTKLLPLLLAFVLIFSSCEKPQDENNGPAHVDYAASVSMGSDTLRQTVTVHAYIDGDTTHFNVPSSVMPGGILKARYLGINTPESTGKIEEWGKTAATFTKEKLLSATEIIIESDDGKWNADSTGGRYLVWVWYKSEGSSEFRNLNIEILQEGLAIASNSANNRYGATCMSAINQAKAEKLHVHSKEKDPNFPYGSANEITLKELRTNTAEYSGQKVSVEGLVTYNSNYTVYIEAYDAESDLYYGMQVFYGYNSALHSVLAQGNRVRVVGVVSDFHGTWQISGLEYNPMKPNDPANTAKLEGGVGVSFNEITMDEFYGDVTVSMGENENGEIEEQTFKFTRLCVSTAVAMKNLQVIDVYTTKNGDNAGAMTLTCKVEGSNQTIDVRTEVLKDADGKIITEEYFMYKTIDVQGLIDYFDLNDTGNGTYQIKVYTLDDVTVH